MNINRTIGFNETTHVKAVSMASCQFKYTGPAIRSEQCRIASH